MLWPQTPPWEIAVRVIGIYLMLLVLVRLVGKREVGQLGPIDLLAMLILSETVSPVLTKQDESLGAAGIAAATLLGLGAAIGRLSYWSPAVERLVDGKSTILVEDGRLRADVARRERITMSELAQALRSAGLEHLHDVQRAVIETNGQISVVPVKDMR